MEWIYLCFVVFLFMLAISDLWVGVSNDAVNFLNSAVGAKAAKFRTAIIVAALGVFCGATMSNGMMDIARHGIFQPEHFAFSELMYIFLAVMVTDIILLDTFNSLGMPTSTTVSMVFELLGASFAFTLLKMNGDDGTLGFSDYLNTSKALSVIVGIFVSVAIAFTIGAIVQWITRMIFTFKYSGKLKWKIGIFGGFAVTCIVYFMLLKGIKTMSFMNADIKHWIADNTWIILGGCMVFFTTLMQLLHVCKVNIFKVVVLIGTFALATAFAGNDLVNFIGVPLAGYESFIDWRNSGSGDPSTHMMGVLNGEARTPFVFLLAAGIIMVISLATSKKAHNVTKTEINLAKQDEGEEMFGSSKVSRSLVRMTSSAANFIIRHTPDSVRSWIDKRFDNTEIEKEEGASYDLVRASVNLVVSSLLIALGTSMKLPLSTTYVTFMVAMGTSLADKAWSRESAVYRVTGVLSVIGGWFMTAGIAFTAAFIIAVIMHFGGVVAAVIVVMVGLGAMIHSNLKYKMKNDEENGDKTFRAILNSEDKKHTWDLLRGYVAANESEVLIDIAFHYDNITEGLMTENVKKLRKSFYELKDNKDKLKNFRRKETICMRRIDQETAMTKNAWFFASFNELEQLYYSIRRMCEPAYDHVDNNFTPLPQKYVDDFRPQKEALKNCIGDFRMISSRGEFERLRDLEPRLSGLQNEFSDMRKELMNDIQAKQVNINTAYLYLNILQESESMTITLLRLTRSSRKFQLG
ncbi:MAG: inorganic phosphate transporter [Bacteroidales bacterium]|nr:inorganic phosphate transporter [Bacteroidales bacterium]MBQ6687911.1 inorganic phosphate transporter [Bacteroidales bacterium]